MDVDNRGMLLPRFSVRTALALTAIIALLSLTASLALRGHDWAGAVTIAILCLVVCFLLYGACFLVAWQLAGYSVVCRAPSQRRRSPTTRCLHGLYLLKTTRPRE